MQRQKGKIKFPLVFFFFSQFDKRWERWKWDLFSHVSFSLCVCIYPCEVLKEAKKRKKVAGGCKNSPGPKSSLALE